MALVTSTEMFKKAYAGGYAIGAFNVNNMEIVQGITEACGELALAVNTTTDEAEAKQLADELMDVAMDQYRIYPLTYTNYVLVSQKNVTGLDSSPIVPEFADYLGISVNG